MTIGPHVYGDGRIGCWFVWHGTAPDPPTEFRDRLKHRVPRIKAALGMTDVFLPREATVADKQIVLDNGCFAALYETPPTSSDLAEQYAIRAISDVNRLKVGACELNVEGVPDSGLAKYLRDTVTAIRGAKPGLRLRINVVPWKAQFLPVDLFVSDAQLYLIIQNYLGNMDARVPEDQIVRNAVDWGIPAGKVSVMYGAHISPEQGKPRVPSLPTQIRYRGSFYQDDLIADAGYIS